jgi:hypothetical protein
VQSLAASSDWTASVGKGYGLGTVLIEYRKRGEGSSRVDMVSTDAEQFEGRQAVRTASQKPNWGQQGKKIALIALYIFTPSSISPCKPPCSVTPNVLLQLVIHEKFP